MIVQILLGVSAALYLLKLYLRRAKFTKTTKITDKVIVITGANTGIGKANAIDLAQRGGKVYIACRDITRGENALREIKRESGSENIFFLQLDLNSIASIKVFSQKFHKLETKLHILINNAAIAIGPRKLTEDGFEQQFGVNHLGHFLLTHLLLDLLKKASPSRIVIVSSEGHRYGKIIKDDLMSEQNYKSFNAYCQTKLANVLFANELTKRLAGTGVTANSLHPGAVNTEIFRDMKFVAKIIVPLLKPWMKTPLEGAQTQIRLAVDPELEKVSGKYFDNCSEAKMSKDAQDEELATWLFNKSLELLKLKKF